MGLCSIALTVTAVTTLMLGAFVYRRVPDRPGSRLFAVHTVCVAAWLLCNALVVVSSDHAHITALLRLAHALTAFMVATLVDFVWAFPDRLRWGPSGPRLALYLAATGVAAVVSLPDLVSSVTLTPVGPTATFGWPLLVFALYALPLIVYCNVVLIAKARRLSGIARAQMWHVLVGTVASELFIIITNLGLPIITGRTEYGGWGAAGYIFTVIAVAVAITRHHLWDLGSGARRIAAATLAAGVLAGGSVVVRYLVALAWVGTEPVTPPASGWQRASLSDCCSPRRIRPLAGSCSAVPGPTARESADC